MKLTVRGYKSISTATAIDLDGLTILSGANSSGKSSFMQPFLLLKQTEETNFDTGAILLDGANARISDSTEALSRVQGRKSKTFSLKVADGERSSAITFKRDPDAGLVADHVELIDKEMPNGLRISSGMKHSEIESRLPEKKNPFRSFFENKKHTAQWKIIRNKCFLDIQYGQEGENSSPFKFGLSPAAVIQKFVQNLIHVPGLRGNPERAYRIADSGTVFPGSFESYVASIISKWKSDPKQHEKLALLVSDLTELGLASAIDTNRLNDTRLEVRVSRHSGSSAMDSVNIADVGFGVSQALPVLVALLAAKRQQVVYIEQPELHLHPRAQHRLAKILARAITGDIRVVIETHSSILLRGIQTLVANGTLDRGRIALYWFRQDSKSGGSVVSQAKLDAQGAFGDWPADFDEVSLNAEDEYLNAVEDSIRAGKKA
jgi:predicted ATPase